MSGGEGEGARLEAALAEPVEPPDVLLRLVIGVRTVRELAQTHGPPDLVHTVTDSDIQ